MNKQHKKPRCDDMYRAILTLKTVEECKQFLMTCARSRSCRPWSSAIRWRSISTPA